MSNQIEEHEKGGEAQVSGGVFPFFENMKKRTRDIILWYAEHKHAGRVLGFFSFIESIFFPVPPDVLLIAIVGARERARWAYYAFITTIWSVVGGVIGYAIGHFLYDSVGATLVSFYGLEPELAKATTLLANNEFAAIFLAGFTPIPYKVFTLGAGFLSLSLGVFVAASILSRAMRFFAVAYIIKVFGREIGAFAFKYFNILTLVIGAIVILLILFLNTHP